MADVTGFVAPSDTSSGGFSFNSFLNSVGGSLNQWALSAINRQTGLDTSGRPVVNPVEQQTMFSKIKTFATSTTGMLTIAGVLVVGFFLYKKLR
jgi:hypothetical protein